MIDRYGDRPDTPGDRPAPTITSKARSDHLIRHTHTHTHLSAGVGPNHNGTLRPVDEPAPTLAFGHNAAGWEWVVRTNHTTGSGYDGTRRVNYERPIDEAAPTLGTRADLWVVNTRQKSLKGGKRTEDYKRGGSRPAPTMTAQAGGFWQWEKPATTVCGDPRITARCHHDEGSQGRNPKTTEQVQAGDYDGTEPIKLTIEEALILQGFRPDWPVQGSRSKKFEQIGNAVPPPLAAAIVSALMAP